MAFTSPLLETPVRTAKEDQHVSTVHIPRIPWKAQNFWLIARFVYPLKVLEALLHIGTRCVVSTFTQYYEEHVKM